MCYPKPGPRCSGHARKRIAHINEEHLTLVAAGDFDGAFEKQLEMVSAKMDWNKTPEGIKELRAQGLTTEADYFAGEREKAIQEYKATLAEGVEAVEMTHEEEEGVAPASPPVEVLSAPTPVSVPEPEEHEEPEATEANDSTVGTETENDEPSLVYDNDRIRAAGENAHVYTTEDITRDNVGYGQFRRDGIQALHGRASWYSTDGETWKRACRKCGGSGSHWATHRSMHQAGDCFRCAGHGTDNQTAPRDTNTLLAKLTADSRSDAREAERRSQESAHNETIHALREERRQEAERVAAEARANDPNATKYLDAALDEKVDVVGRVVNVYEYEGRAYGYNAGTETRRIVTLDLGGGVRVKTFTGARWAVDLEPGHEIRMTGEVRKHEEYRGEKATVLGKPRMKPIE